MLFLEKSASLTFYFTEIADFDKCEFALLKKFEEKFFRNQPKSENPFLRNKPILKLRNPKFILMPIHEMDYPISLLEQI